VIRMVLNLDHVRFSPPKNTNKLTINILNIVVQKTTLRVLEAIC